MILFWMILGAIIGLMVGQPSKRRDDLGTSVDWMNDRY
jgi:hypothetical protein